MKKDRKNPNCWKASAGKYIIVKGDPTSYTSEIILSPIDSIDNYTEIDIADAVDPVIKPAEMADDKIYEGFVENPIDPTAFLYIKDPALLELLKERYLLQQKQLEEEKKDDN